MIPTRAIASCAALAAAVLIGGAAAASVVLPLDVPALTRKADIVVRGRARATVSKLVTQTGRIVSTTPIVVTDRLKGQAPEVVEVRAPGGAVGNVMQRVDGAPQFAEGEEVFLFLRRQRGKGKTWEVVGLAQGKFTVERGASGRAHVVRRTPGLAVRKPDGGVEPAPAVEPIPEEDFVARVRGALIEKDSP